MDQPDHIDGARICILRYPDEITVCANIEGFREIGNWIAWLVASNPTEMFHMHFLWHLESAASRFEGVTPKNVWHLVQSESPRLPADAPPGAVIRDFELTFHVVDEATLDELAAHQESGSIPERFRKRESSFTLDCE
ncbi:MAG TPA: hypothetical protein VFV97_15070 [Rhodanobacteraceae bacterium]|nr:hypothetical protein [Rhodanobacteraceae bacterium]